MRNNFCRTALRLSIILVLFFTLSLCGARAEEPGTAPTEEAEANPISAVIGLLASFLITWLKRIEWVEDNPRYVAVAIAVLTTILQHFTGVMPDNQWVTWLLTLLLTISGQEIGWNLLLKPGARKLGIVPDKR